jgi:Tfp pilus assembly protein PilO
MRIDLTKRAIFKILLLVFALLAIFTGMLWPTVVNIRSTIGEILDLRGYIEQKYNQSILSRVTKRKITDIKNDYPDLSRHLFRKGEELKLITYLEEMALKNNLTQTINNSNIDKITDNKVVFSLNLTGDYDNIIKYLVDLESSEYLLNIEQLQLTPIFNRSGQNTEDANLYLTLGLYVSK